MRGGGECWVVGEGVGGTFSLNKNIYHNPWILLVKKSSAPGG